MPVRVRIIVLFSSLVFIILGFVCSSIYYFSSISRVENIQRRLRNRAITTARLLSRSEIFDRQLVEHIDSLTTISLKDKSVQAYNNHNQTIYRYSDRPDDSISISSEILDEARTKGQLYFTTGSREAIAYHYTVAGARILVLCAAEDQDGKQVLAQLRNRLLLSFFTGIAFTVICGYFFSRSLLKPISDISDEVEEITAQNLTKRIPTGKSKDEWYKLSSTINELLNRLQSSFELQRRFISNASHELSTPLTSISSQLEIALQRERSNEQYEKMIAAVLKDVQHMNKLTQTLLEFAKAAGDKGGLHIDLLRIDEMLMQLPAALKKEHYGYEIFLRFDQLPENENELLLFGNEALLFTALKNIAVNACKYSPDRRAEIVLSVFDKYFEIRVSNRGPGIPDADLQHIFQPFFRGQNEQQRQPGFGLGLPLASQIVKMHKGEITVVSVGGDHTEFTVRLPGTHT